LSPNHLKNLWSPDLLSNTLTPGVPTAITIGLVATDDTGPGTCNAASEGQTVGGLRAWGTTLHAAPGGAYAVTEAAFQVAPLSVSEYAKMTTYCAFIQADGSGHGTCSYCESGAAGAAKKN
jgi:hypothetical protein